MPRSKRRSCVNFSSKLASAVVAEFEPIGAASSARPQETMGMLVLSQLLSQAPLLLAYMAAIGLAAINWQRCPTPAMLTLAAAALLLLVAILQPVLSQVLIDAHLPGGPAQIG